MFGKRSLVALGLLACVATGFAAGRLTELPPHWLDSDFEKSPKYRQFVTKGAFAAAVDQALKKAEAARKDKEQELSEKPNLVGPSPKTSARSVFIEELKKRLDDNNFKIEAKAPDEKLLSIIND